jgi:integrase
MMTPLKGDGLSGRQVDVVLPAPVGRVCKAWGTADRKKRAERKQMLFDLVDYGQIDVLVAFRDGDRTWTDLLHAKRTKQLASASLATDLLLDRELWGEQGAIATTLAKMGKSQQSRQRYESSFTALEVATGGRPVVRTVAGLLGLEWDEVWKQLARLSPASRNRMRSAVSAFLTVFLGDKYHPFRRQVVKAMGGKEEEGSAVPRTITLEEFVKLLKLLPEPVVPCVLTLAATGMRVAEYLQCREAELRRFPTIEIPGGKTGADTVQVARWLEPYVRMAIPCALAPAPKYEGSYPGVQFDARYKVLYREIRAASEKLGVACSPHYLRHLFAALAVQSTDPVRAQHALRHKTAGMTAHYAKEKDGQVVAEGVGNRLRGVRDIVRDRATTKRKRKPANTARSTRKTRHSK